MLTMAAIRKCIYSVIFFPKYFVLYSQILNVPAKTKVSFLIRVFVYIERKKQHGHEQTHAYHILTLIWIHDKVYIYISPFPISKLSMKD